MICRHCGTEIADKALICYRCGNPTADPVRPAAAPARRRAGGLISLVALAALVLAGLFLGQAGRAELPPAVPYTIAVLAAMVLAWRVWRRRR
jgi:hypothetical protein